MSCDDFREDLEAYALGALEPSEARRVAIHLQECSEDCNAIVSAYQVAIDYLALSVPFHHASPKLKDRLLGGIGAIRQPVYARVLANRWFAGAVAAVLVAMAVGGVTWATILSTKIDRLQKDNQALAQLTQLDAEQRARLLKMQGDLSSAQTEQGRMNNKLEELSTLTVIALDPDLIPTGLEGTALAPSSKCSYVWSTKQSYGALTCKDLPSTAFALTYELWAVKGDKTVPLGNFGPRLDGSASLLVKFPTEVTGPVSNMWVTLEQASTQPRSKPSNDVVLQRSPESQAAR